MRPSKIDRLKIQATIEGYMTGARIGETELCTAALVLDAALGELESEAAEMRELLGLVDEARGARELEHAQDQVRAFQRRAHLLLPSS